MLVISASNFKEISAHPFLPTFRCSSIADSSPPLTSAPEKKRIKSEECGEPPCSVDILLRFARAIKLIEPVGS